MSDITKKIAGFVSLNTVRKGAPDPAAALAEIRRIYFNTTKQTIDHDFAHAIELLKSLPDEDTRDRAAVFMEGLNEMRREWEADAKRKARAGAKAGAGRKTGARSARKKRPE